MEIMNYLEMLENAETVKKLTEKTIECSKDYVESRKTDVIDQMLEYIMNTLSDILHSDLINSHVFRRQANLSKGLSFSSFGTSRGPASVQFFYNNGDGTYLRAYFTQQGYWCEQNNLSQSSLSCLIKEWPEYKTSWKNNLKWAINAVNERASKDLAKQLEIHETIKNFTV